MFALLALLALLAPSPTVAIAISPRVVRLPRAPAVGQSFFHSPVRMLASSADGFSAGAPQEPSEALPARKVSISVFSVLAAAFLNLLGFTMMLGLTPALGSHFKLPVGARFGSLTSAYPIGMLAGVFIWPSLSDRVGRVPVLALSLAGSGCGLMAQSISLVRGWPLEVFLGLRALTGSCAGASPIAKAYLADMGASRGKLPRYLSLRDAAGTLAFIVGPAISGQIFRAVSQRCDVSIALATVIGTAAAGSGLAAALVALLASPPPKVDANTLKEARESMKQQKPEYSSTIACPLGATLVAGVVSVCFVSGLKDFGGSAFDAFFAVLCKTRIGLDTRSITLAYSGLNCLSLAVSTLISSRAIKLLGPVLACCVGLSLISLGLLGVGSVVAVGNGILSVSAQSAFWGFVCLYQVGVPLFGPTVPTMLLQCVPPNRRGTVMGIDNAVNTIAKIIAPLCLGMLFARAGAGACFKVAGVVVGLSAFLAAFRRLLVMRS